LREAIDVKQTADIEFQDIIDFTMNYELKPVESNTQSDKIIWSCPCGLPLELEFRITEKGIWYPFDGVADSVTGGVTVPCPECRRQFFLPSMAVSPSVSEVIPNEP
jgi:hypothetical protein